MNFKSQAGFALVKLTIKVIVLMLFLGVTGYVVLQKNGVLERATQNIETNINAENTVNMVMVEEIK